MMGFFRRSWCILFISIAVFTGNDTAHAQFGGGDGSPQAPYRVATPEQLQEVGRHLDKHFIQVADIDAQAINDWEPIGGPDSTFTGSYDGQEYSIINLSIVRPEWTSTSRTDYIGLFGYLEGATVKNIVLENVFIFIREITRRVGSIAGFTDENSVLYNIHSEGSVRDSHDYLGGNGPYGGLTGINYGVIHKSSFEGTVGTATGSVFGGIAGINYGEIHDSKANASLQGRGLIGGLVGLNHGTINRSYVTEGVLRGYYAVGGFAGINEGIITESFSKADITAHEGASGGFTGHNAGLLKNVYARGSVAGSGPTGGLAGKNTGQVEVTYSAVIFETKSMYSWFGGLIGENDPEGMVKISYWDVIKAETQVGVGNDAEAEGLQGLKTGEMTGTSAYQYMEGFGFSESWVLTEGYPALSWEDPEDQLEFIYPEMVELNQNYPNPFNSSTIITFELPSESRIILELFDVTGRRVSLLLDARRSMGYHQVEFDAAGLASGMYIYVLRLPDHNLKSSQKMLLVK